MWDLFPYNLVLFVFFQHKFIVFITSLLHMLNLSLCILFLFYYKWSYSLNFIVVCSWLLHRNTKNLCILYNIYKVTSKKFYLVLFPSLFISFNSFSLNYLEFSLSKIIPSTKTVLFLPFHWNTSYFPGLWSYSSQYLQHAVILFLIIKGSFCFLSSFWKVWCFPQGLKTNNNIV